jgi:hypothetical protein
MVNERLIHQAKNGRDSNINKEAKRMKTIGFKPKERALKKWH